MARTRGEAPADHEELSETQRKILTAALEVFSERGFAGASTASIAERAGVAEKTLFAQFKSKSALLARTIRPSVFLLVEPRALERVHDALGSADGGLAALLRAVLRDRLSLVAEHPKKLRLIAHEVLLRPELITSFEGAFGERVAPLFGATLAALASRGELRPDLPPKTILRTLVSVGVGYAISRHVLGLEPDVDEATEIDRMVSLLTDGLRPRVPPQTA